MSLFATLVLFATGGTASAWAASGDTVPSAYVTDGPVYAIAHDNSDGSTYIGGNFSVVGPRTGSGMVLEQSTTNLEPTFAGDGNPDTVPFPEVAGGRILAVASDGFGGWFIGGDFSYVGGELRHGIAHIESNGSLDEAWDPGATGGQSRVDAIAVDADNGVVYMGGNFDTVDGQTRNDIAAVDESTGSAISGWNPGADGEVRALAFANGVLYAGGDFANLDGQPRSHVGAIDSNGDATSWAPDADGPVSAIATSSTNTVYAGGSFSSIGGQARSNIAELDSNGDATSWDPSANGTVDAIAASDTKVYAGGFFSGPNSIGGASRDHLAALDPSTGGATGWNPGPNDVVRSLAVSSGLVYVGGDFTSASTSGTDPRQHLAALDATSGTPTTWNPDPNDSVLALAVGVGTSNVYAGGSFVTAGPDVVDRANIARLHADGTLDTAWNPGADGPVKALALSGGELYVGGAFSAIDGTPRGNLARLDASSGDVDPGWAPSTDGEVRALAVSPGGGTIYVGGGFLSLSDGTNSVGDYLGSVGSDGVVNPGWSPSPDAAPINALAVSPDGNTVYASGGFGQIGGQTRAGLAALDASSGSALSGSGWDDGVFPFGPSALAVADGNLYAGGDFTGIGGSVRDRIAAVDPSSGVATGWDPDICSGGVHALAVSPDGNTVYAGGEFAFVGGCSGSFRNDLVAVDATSGLATAWNPFPNGQVDALAIAGDGNTVYAGGEFTAVGGRATTYFAQIDSTQIGFHPFPNGRDFGSQAVGTQSSTQPFTITNDGLFDLHISSVSLTGTDPGDFTLSSDTCSGATVSPGDTCTVDVAFAPTATGARTATLEFADDADGNPQDLPLSGTGTTSGPDGSLSPSVVNFGSLQVGVNSAAQQFTLTDTGSAPLVISSVSLAGANPSEFQISGNSCGGATVNPGLTCTVGVKFAPTSSGAKAARLDIADNAPGSPQSAALNGTGTTPPPPGPGPGSDSGSGSGSGGAPKPIDTTIVKGPKKSTTQHSATFMFSSNVVGLRFECKVDKRGFVGCASPMKVNGLKPGKHMFQVRAIGDGSPATFGWTVKR